VTLAPIDLRFQDAERIIGVYLVETPEGPALFDCGPATTFERLQQEVDLRSIRHLLLSHIHLDHAGAAGHVVRANPDIRVHVSEVGAPHLVDPSRLLSSARRLYGDSLDELYGEPLPVPEENVEPIWDTAAGLKSFPTTGHAWHHVSYLTDDGTLLAGDAVGVRLLPDGKHVLPHSPPPEIDLDAWEKTFDEILVHQPARLALIHFGIVEGTEEVAEHVARTRETLALWSQRVQDGMSQDEFVAAAGRDLEQSEGERAHEYLRAAPIDQAYLGIERYWRKKGEVDAEAAASR
jgi:glyoxylase-like metal-dependent hydrolase (beta-lactamase superfamily II)